MPRRARIAAAVGAVLLIAVGVAYWLLRPPPGARLTLTAASYAVFTGWAEDPLAMALPALQQSCRAILGKSDAAPIDAKTESGNFGAVRDWRQPCAAIAAVATDDRASLQQLFERDFVPLLAGNNGDSSGLFTGYFEITLHGARQRGGAFQTPLYRRPPEAARTLYARAEIENGALAGQGLELCWVDDPVDAFFLEIQGSGLVRLREGGTMRVGFDGQNGRPYVAVGRLLVERGEMPREQVTMAAIRAWMKAHPKEGAALRQDNPSYVFFREVKGEGPLGAERVPLTAGRSLAVDRRFIPLGVPIWLEAQQRFGAGTIRRLVVAQDAGGAIKGPVRGDLFWGHGNDAADSAGAMNASGRYFLLLPRAIAARLGSQ